MHVNNIIIGAGPAGLQAAYLFKKYNIEYIILEKYSFCSSFLKKFPHSGELISINKKNTGSTNRDFNLRHDWNSLLNDDEFLFTDFDDNYYPCNQNYIHYLNAFIDKFSIQIKYNCCVNKITKNNDKYIIETNNNLYSCDKLIIATGLSCPNYPDICYNTIDKIPHYDCFKSQFFKEKENLDEYTNKKILLIGLGNSSLELANILNEYASSILIYSRHNSKWAMSSHYTGNLRAKYLSYLDTFLLKSLNGINFYHDSSITIKQEIANGKYIIYETTNENKYIKHTREYDKVILCTGWKFDSSIFDFQIETIYNNKYPKISFNYESTNNRNLFFIGSLMHSNDYKKSSGGFIHGFRYLIDLFVKLNYKPYAFYKQVFSCDNIENDVITLTLHICNRINTASSIYQMYGILCDFFFYNPTYKQFMYMHDLSLDCVKNMSLIDDTFNYFVLTLEYGSKNITDVYQLGLKFSVLGKESMSSLLHPVLKIFNQKHEIIDIFHFDEDLFAEFTDINLYNKRFASIIKGYYI